MGLWNHNLLSQLLLRVVQHCTALKKVFWEKILSLSFSWKYKLWRWIKKILAIRQKKWNRSLIILVDLTKLIVSDKLFLDIQLIHSFMPNLLQKSWMVSTKDWLIQNRTKHTVAIHYWVWYDFLWISLYLLFN